MKVDFQVLLTGELDAPDETETRYLQEKVNAFVESCLYPTVGQSYKLVVTTTQVGMKVRERTLIDELREARTEAERPATDHGAEDLDRTIN